MAILIQKESGVINVIDDSKAVGNQINSTLSLGSIAKPITRSPLNDEVHVFDDKGKLTYRFKLDGTLRYQDEGGASALWVGDVDDLANKLNNEYFPKSAGLPWELAYAQNRIKNQYGDTVSIDQKLKNLIKFGKNDMVGTTQATLMTLPGSETKETYTFTNSIESVSSSSSSDLSIISVEGHTVEDSQAISSLTQSAGLATAVIVGHGYNSDEWVFINGTSSAEYAGIVQITVVDDDTFTYTLSASAPATAVGTPFSTNQKLTFVAQDVVLDGENIVTLATPMCRANRAYVKNQNQAASKDRNNGATNGDIYIFEGNSATAGVPDDDTSVHLIMPQNANVTFKAVTAISDSDYFIIESITPFLLAKKNSFVDIRLQVREQGGVWRAFAPNIPISESQTVFTYKPSGCMIVPKNSDVRLIATSSEASTSVGGSVEGYLAKVI